MNALPSHTQSCRAVKEEAASGAAPGVLRARDLTRPIGHYLYRPHVRPRPTRPATSSTGRGPTGEAQALQNAADFGFAACDGGLFNDDPAGLAHEALAGLVGLNPRSPACAHQALLMIHPLAQRRPGCPRRGRGCFRCSHTCWTC